LFLSSPVPLTLHLARDFLMLFTLPQVLPAPAEFCLPWKPCSFAPPHLAQGCSTLYRSPCSTAWIYCVQDYVLHSLNELMGVLLS
jgi:hypothetical protein